LYTVISTPAAGLPAKKNASETTTATPAIHEPVTSTFRVRIKPSPFAKSLNDYISYPILNNVSNSAGMTGVVLDADQTMCIERAAAGREDRLSDSRGRVKTEGKKEKDSVPF
jgi:hypothetical protein